MNVTLSGGPFDGKTVAWSGGDYLEMAPKMTLDFSVTTVEPFKVEKSLYRRSANNPNIFVFQP